jgi:hypothetical protein
MRGVNTHSLAQIISTWTPVSECLTIWCRNSTIDDAQCDAETTESPLQSSAKNVQSNDSSLNLRSSADYIAYLTPAPK